MSDIITRIITDDCCSTAIAMRSNEVISYLSSVGITAEIENYWDDVFIDCGENLEEIICPCCGETVDFDWWGNEMERCLNADLFETKVTMPCCGKTSYLDKLIYHDQCGFAEYAAVIQNESLSDENVKKLEAIVGEKLRVITAKY